jgi:uncharacterized protein
MQRVNERAIRFGSADVGLDGRIAVPDGARRGAVVCHPHPQYGGDMDNSVVCAVSEALQRRGVATLRFNFRGVGDSEGSYGGGVGEIEDARAAVDALREHVPTIALAGYSFGAMVALLAGHGDPKLERLVAIALPATMFDLEPIVHSAKPKLFLIGDRDQYCRYSALEALVGRLAGENSLVRLEGADHFLFGFEERVGAEVARFVAD